MTPAETQLNKKAQYKHIVCIDTEQHKSP